ncbi:Acetylxylan esterase 2 [Hyphodiscus hymeniophilus]|uniref:Acetylxylan esterase 2 n=1 Tax=Hyphodiscus hymeniophilus TaxID=353542 RepID=A0A9P6VG71_9HELO|nr:Acetylxylan esterase 2 [Hyphodiscus hymeniophilus]
MLLTSAILLLLDHALASPVDVLEKRQCPSIHIFGARETTAPPGYGSSDTVVNGVIAAHPGATSEAINYPACGGQASCGGDSYSQSVAAGVAAAVSAVNSYASQCPSTQLVLVGYSQGSEIFDVALCGGGDPNQGLANSGVEFSAAAVANIKAAIFMGDPLYHTGLPYNVGTCAAGGFDARPAGFTCPNAAKIKSYCDSTDPYCCNGSNAATHQGYGAEYGSQAIAFVNSKLSATSGGGGTGTPTTSSTSTPTGGSGGGGGTVAKYVNPAPLV